MSSSKGKVNGTECTQRGNDHFLAYIPSWWKNQSSLVRAEGVQPPPPFTISIKKGYRHKVMVCMGYTHPPPFTTISTITKLWCTLKLRGQIHSLYFYSTPMYSVVESVSWTVRDFKFENSFLNSLIHYCSTVTQIILSKANPVVCNPTI